MNLLGILEIIEKFQQNRVIKVVSTVQTYSISLQTSMICKVPINQIQSIYKSSLGPQQTARGTKAFWCVLQDSQRGQASEFTVTTATQLAIVWSEPPDHHEEPKHFPTPGSSVQP